MSQEKKNMNKLDSFDIDLDLDLLTETSVIESLPPVNQPVPIPATKVLDEWEQVLSNLTLQHNVRRIPVKTTKGTLMKEVKYCTAEEFYDWAKEVFPPFALSPLDNGLFDTEKERNSIFDSIIVFSTKLSDSWKKASQNLKKL